MEELFVLVGASASEDDVVTKGMVVPRGSGGAHGGLHIRRGWLGGLSVSIASTPSIGNAVDVTVLPTSKVQSTLLTLVFFGFTTVGLSVGCGVGEGERFMFGIAGLFVGLFIGILAVAMIQRLGIAVAGDATAATNALASDVGRWAERRRTLT